MTTLETIKTEIITISSQAKEKIDLINSSYELEKIKQELLGKKSAISQTMEKMRTMSHEDKRSIGQFVNEAKKEIEQKIASRNIVLLEIEEQKKLAAESIDISLPARNQLQPCPNTDHPIVETMSTLRKIAYDLGFKFAEGEEIVREFFNFDALNINHDHPARQMQDTLYIKKIETDSLKNRENLAIKEENISDFDKEKSLPLNTFSHQDHDQQFPSKGRILLRTHTSSVQIKHGLNYCPPIRTASMGKVYRADEVDQTHSPMFHQIELMYIDKEVNVAHLKHCWHQLLGEILEKDNPVLRFRISYFPFTEPSLEVDLGCIRNEITGKIDLASNREEVNKWMEIGGSGMIHPTVLRNIGIDPKQWSGFAMGMGIERMAMLRHQINDIRHFYEGDIRLLRRWSQA